MLALFGGIESKYAYFIYSIVLFLEMCLRAFDKFTSEKQKRQPREARKRSSEGEIISMTAHTEHSLFDYTCVYLYVVWQYYHHHRHRQNTRSRM